MASSVDLSADGLIEQLEHRERSSGLDSESEESSDHSPEGEDMELSYASSSSSGNDSGDTSDHVHEPEGIHPFLYEPIADDSSSSSSSSDESEETSQRLLDLDW